MPAHPVIDETAAAVALTFQRCSAPEDGSRHGVPRLDEVILSASRLRLNRMVRPEGWIRLAGESPVPVGAGASGSRPRFVVERCRAKRGVESFFGGSKCTGCSGNANSAASAQLQRESRAAQSR